MIKAAIEIRKVSDEFCERGLCTGMGGVVRFFEAFGGEMGINLRRDEVRMAEEFLDAAQVSAGVEEVRGVTVAEFVRGQVWVEAGEGEILFQPELQNAGGQRLLSAAAPEHGGGFGRVGRQALPVGLDGFQGRFTDGDESFLFSFAPNADQQFPPIEIAGLKTAQFADSEAGGVDRFQDRAVTMAGQD